MTDLTGLHTNLSNDEYHALTDWYSSSQLKAALPESYKPFTGTTDALDFGTLFHTVVLEPDNLSGYVALDANKIGVKADGTPAQNPTMTGAWKKAVAEAESDGLTVIAQDALDRAFAMRDAITNHPEANELMFADGGTNEESAFAVDENGIRHKARFDRRIPGAIVDLKSTASQPGADSLTKAVLNYGYEVSAAHYLTVAELLGLDAPTFTLVFVGKTAPYHVTVADLDDLLIMRGNNLRALALERIGQQVEPYEGASGRLILTCPMWALPYDDEMEIA